MCTGGDDRDETTEMAKGCTMAMHNEDFLSVFLRLSSHDLQRFTKYSYMSIGEFPKGISDTLF